MNRIAGIFSRTAPKKGKALVGFVTAGDPSIECSREIVCAMCASGLDMLEIGVPFSDPTADGQVIRRSYRRALSNGTTLQTVFEMTASLRRSFQGPVIVCSYYKPIYLYGVAAFCRDSKKAGADGVLVVDLPPEGSDELSSCCKDENFSLIRLIVPDMPEERIAAISASVSGFLYIVSMTGVTGGSGLNLSEVHRLCRRVRRYTALPLCVGFGISSVDDVAGVSRSADGVIIGSAFARLIEENIGRSNLAEILAERTRQYKGATKT